ncbi:MAG TPA: chemotaxis protein CheA [Burkholderiales bacterium]|nr:chemotaxis protein CheA [Burkholderiales bacterium]
MSIDLRQFHASFFSESLEGLDATEANLLRLEGGERSPELLNAIFRAIHSIKGAAGSLGFPEIGRFTHEFENVLDDLRSGGFDPDAEGVDTMLACVDHVRHALRLAQKDQPYDGERDAALLERLAAMRGAAPGPGTPASAPARAAGGTFRIRFRPGPGFFASGNDAVKLIRVLDGMGELKVRADLAALPDAAAFDPETCYLAWELDLRTERDRQEVAEVFGWVEDDCVVEIEGGAREGEEPAQPPAPAAPAAAAIPERRRDDRRKGDRRTGPRRTDDPDLLQGRSDILHVGRAKLDSLMNAVGELVITKTILKQILSTFERGGDGAGRLDEAMQELESHARDLQDSVMAIRMQPMSFAFGRFQRIVRDHCQASGKLVQLRVTGEASELDSTVIEKLVDPLTHLVRNALDHGVESPADRVAAGKLETATLSLHAEHRGGNIEIVVADDGRGINRERVRAKALERGLVDADEALTDERIHDLIFAPGFSTAEKLNELSGRGVGLDVVRKNVGELNGTIRIESEPGRGTRFVIRLPLTLAIVDGMRVAVGSETYILPLASIVECIRPGAAEVRPIAGQGHVVEVRGEYLPLVPLGGLFGVASMGADQGILVVLEADGERIALLVDALLGQEQVVIKTLEVNYRKVPFVAGATILGEGRVVLILDVASLVRSVRQQPQLQA